MRPLRLLVLAWGLVMGSAMAVPAAGAHSAPRRAPAQVSIEARPPAPVRVFINGRKLGTTPITNATIRPGRHTIEAIRPDGVRLRHVLRVLPAQHTKIVLAD